jgi:hypothetical protein
MTQRQPHRARAGVRGNRGVSGRNDSVTAMVLSGGPGIGDTTVAPINGRRVPFVYIWGMNPNCIIMPAMSG